MKMLLKELWIMASVCIESPAIPVSQCITSIGLATKFYNDLQMYIILYNIIQ